jgi:hypothetical protein
MLRITHDRCCSSRLAMITNETRASVSMSSVDYARRDNSSPRSLWVYAFFIPASLFASAPDDIARLRALISVLVLLFVTPIQD